MTRDVDGRWWMGLVRPLGAPVAAARGYSFKKLQHDVVAGLTVAVVEVPQAMAYALIAGVPPQYGIYTSVIQGVLGALLSSSEHLTTGPTNTQSLLVASTLAHLVAGGSIETYLTVVFALTFLKGLIQLMFAAARMGELLRYVSRSVITGVATGAGVLIIVGQIPAFFGIPTVAVTDPWPGVIGSVQEIWPNVTEINPRAVMIGVGCLIIVVGGRLISPFVPGALMAVLLGGAAVWGLGWGPEHLTLVSPIPAQLPKFSLPPVDWPSMQSLFGGALALAVLGMIESVAIGKSLAVQSGDRINANQEFYAQGVANFVSSFFQCIPGSGSFTRSALDHAAGAETRFAAIFNAGFVASIFLLLAGWAKYIPLASLAAVLFVIATGLIDWRYIVRVAQTSRSDAIVCITTVVATLVAPLQYAVFVGIFLNIALYLRKASRLHIAEMVPTPMGPFLERPIHDRSGQKQVMFLQVEGDLFFAVADELQDRLNDLVAGDVRVVILRLKRTHYIDATVLYVMDQFARKMHARSRHVILCGVRPELMRVLRVFGLVDLLGRENVFEAGVGMFTSAKRALQRARELVQASIDTRTLDAEMEEEGWAYEI